MKTSTKTRHSSSMKSSGAKHASATGISRREAARIAVRHVGGGHVVGRAKLHGGTYVETVVRGSRRYRVYVGARTGRIVRSVRA
jgi:uncharacterized membrane protein YkoI